MKQGPCVLVTMNLILGSAPRESGCRMIVSESQCLGSIGGGNLEFTAIAQARELLQKSSQPRQTHQPYGLGPALNQCCGGAVTLLFEVFSGQCPEWLADLARESRQRVLVMAIDQSEPLRIVLLGSESRPDSVPPPVWGEIKDLISTNYNESFTVENSDAIREYEHAGEKWWLELTQVNQPNLALFGAGHVGHAVVRQLEQLPFSVSWIDSRADVFPNALADNIQVLKSEDPAREVARQQTGTLFVVMTHSHRLDEDICYEVLARKEFSWLGLIGSETKRQRFVQRLNKRGIAKEKLQRLICPIGLAGISGKQPANIALSLVAQLMMEKPWIHANN
jgi:xanthine dehydrogenase accessory factor